MKGRRRRNRVDAVLVAAAAGATVVFGFIACDASTFDAPEDAPSGLDAARVDAPPDVLAGDASVGREGGCAAVTGACDLVLQDCAEDATGQKQECVMARLDSGDLTTQCVPVQPSQQLPMGRACCPGSDNPCLPGLTCVGEPCVDGGPSTGRCTPACCEDDHASCGQSDPEGIGGQCDVSLFVGDVEVHRVCSYRERCKPFGVEPCGPGQTCLIEDKVGTASCIASNNVPSRERCAFANDCADGYICAGPPDAGVCRMLCLTPNSNPSFDASAVTFEPGRGGCPSGESCTGPSFQNLPDWIQLCE